MANSKELILGLVLDESQAKIPEASATELEKSQVSPCLSLRLVITYVNWDGSQDSLRVERRREKLWHILASIWAVGSDIKRQCGQAPPGVL